MPKTTQLGRALAKLRAERDVLDMLIRKLEAEVAVAKPPGKKKKAATGDDLKFP